ncbi:DUF6752 domain-containing protein [Cellulosimicrobium cellulans]|uniref:DUF6752 domain-containing protein n=1 Tax=Cellulosimicrobium cellulans TaxID=1710 RepID=UPI001884752E|nr:DUF6752 domain-containing protein [Cellulosimicrobium cellulans]MBE9925210.1 hypothetical protein [Cellulosimicrobium cellulans]QUC00038.1 hypothetical protein J5A69_01710 [Cellulosimicrobium cellulans]
MKQKIIAVGDRVAPGLMARLRGKPLPSHTDVLEELERLREDVRELRAEIDECRRDNVRIAELTDIVESRLAGRPMSS